MSTITKQLSDRAAALANAGWGPLPLPAGMKWQPPKGSIGADDPLPTYADWFAWSEQYPHYTNLGVRLPPGVIGIDVDSYKAAGLNTWLALDGPNWAPTVRVSSRGFENGAGHWFYRVPEGRDAHELPSKWGGIEALRPWHRYSMAPGSINGEIGAEYRAADMRTGEWLTHLPPIDELPEMPIEMWELLISRATGAPRDRDGAPVPDPDLPGLGDPLRGQGEACGAVAAVREPLWAEGSRYDGMVATVWRLVRLHNEGHRGALDALDILRASYIIELDANPRFGGDPPETEFDRAVRTAQAKQGEPTNECHCELGVFEWTEDLEATLWTTSPELQHVYQVAKALRAGPVGTLLALLARLVATVSPNVVLPPLVGGYASINLFTMLVGTSGGGKGACEAAAKQALFYHRWADEETPGSGEGIPHMFAYREKREIVRSRTAVVLTVAEIDTWQALSMRTGSTLDGEIRKAAMGERLGFGYADPAKRIPIDAHSYRLCMVVGVQPGRAEWLLTAASGGTPQRFIWGPVSDRDAPREAPPIPTPRTWQPPSDYPPADQFGFVVLPVCDTAKDQIAEIRWLGLREQIEDPLAGHRGLVQLRVANALGLLHGRAGVNEQDWATAEILMRISDHTRRKVEYSLSEAARAKNIGYALREADKIEVIGTKQEAQCLHDILAKLGRNPDGVKRRALKDTVRSTARSHFVAVLDRAIAAGQVVVGDDGLYRRGATP
jgi:hypothetical protein